MRIRLLLAAICLLALPMSFNGDKLTNSTPFATVALAGHTIAGDWCDNGTQGCISDQGVNRNGPTTDHVKGSAQATTGAGSFLDSGPGMLMLALALLLWTRLRA